MKLVVSHNTRGGSRIFKQKGDEMYEIASANRAFTGVESVPVKDKWPTVTECATNPSSLRSDY